MAEPGSYEWFTEQRAPVPGTAPPAPAAAPKGAGPTPGSYEWFQSGMPGPVAEPGTKESPSGAPDLPSKLLQGTETDEEGGAMPQALQSPHAKSGWFQMLSNSIQRGVGEMGLMPETLGAVLQEGMGNKEAAQTMMHSVEAQSKALPQAEWNLGDVRDLGDFGYWLTERMGENAPNIIAMLGTGGATGMLSLLGRGGLSMASKAALRASATRAGAYAVAAPLSVAGVAREQFGATGSTQPGVSTAAGLAGAWLQTYLPVKLLNGELGPGFWNSVKHGALVGGAFGTGQEALNVMARKYTDPNYSFFSDGPERVGWGWRLFESGVTNVALGAMMGPLGMERGKTPGGLSPFRPEGEVPGQEPGFRADVPPEEPPPGGGAPPGAVEAKFQPILDQWYNLGHRRGGGTLSDDPALAEAFKDPTTPENKALLEKNGYETPRDIEWAQAEHAAYDEGVADRKAGKPADPARAVQPPTPEELTSQEEAHQRRLAESRARFTPEQNALMDQQQKLLQDLWNIDEKKEPERVKELTKQLDEVEAKIAEAIPKRPPGTTLHQMMRLGGPTAGAMRPGGRPRAAPEAPPESTGATAPEPGPISQMRKHLIQVPISPDRNLIESTMGVHGDAFGADPLLRETSEKMRDHERQLEWVEAATPRYAVEDPRYPSGYVPRLLTDTEIEKMSIDYPQGQELKTWEIDQSSLQPAGVTADVFDLPPAHSNRVWFLPGTTPEERVVLLGAFDRLQQRAQDVRALAQVSRSHEATARGGDAESGAKGLEHQYEQLVNHGLRVIPTRGSSFYYNGTFQARRATVKTTGRTPQAVLLDPDSGAMRTKFGFGFLSEDYADALASDQGWNYAVPMALDLNKFKPGEVLGIPPDPIAKGTTPEQAGFTFREDMPPLARKVVWNLAVDLSQRAGYWSDPAVFAEWRDLMKRGLERDPTKPSAFLVTRSEVSLDKLTPGIFHYESNIRLDPVFELPESRVSVDHKFMPLNYHASAVKARLQLAKMLPIIDGMLDKLGIVHDEGTPARLNVEIHPGGEDWMQDTVGTSSNTAYNAGEAMLGLGKIKVYIAGLKSRAASETMSTEGRLALYGMMMHEVGHFVTLRMVARAPAEVQQMLRYAYEKSLLERRLDPEASEYRTAIERQPGEEPGTKISIPYYYTYPEWLAEQFRRWAMSSDEPRTLMERQYKGVAKDLERFYAEWEKAFPETTKGRDLMNPSYHFSAAMHYYRLYGDRSSTGAVLNQLLASLGMAQTSRDVPSHPASDEILQKGPLRAMSEMREMFPPGVRTVIDTWLNPAYGKFEPGTIGRTVSPRPGLWNHPLIELALGALPKASDVRFSRIFFAHELLHAHRMMGLIHESEWGTLVNATKAAGIKLEAAETAHLRRRIEEQGDAMGWDRATRDRHFEDIKQEELVAQYVERFANNEPLGVHPGQGIVKRLLDFTYRIRDLLRGEGFRAREDVLRKFFDGEMSQRPQRAYEESIIREMEKSPPIQPQSIKTIEGLPHIAVATQEVNLGPASPLRHIYKFYDNAAGNVRRARDLVNAKVLGWVTLTQEARGLHISYIKSSGDRFFMMKTMLDHIEKELGDNVLPASEFTDAGYKMARLQYREQMQHYTWVDAIKRWVSPNFIKDNLDIANESGSKLEQQFWRNLYEKVPKETWKNPILNQMFMLPREWMRDEVQGSIGQAGRENDQAGLQSSLGSEPQAPGPDYFTAAKDRANQTDQARNARELGVRFSQGAPRMPTMEMRAISRWAMERISGGREGPEERGELTGIVNEADRIGWFTKRWWDILQLLWNNEHIMGLRTYVGGIKSWQKLISYWQTRADESIRAWNDLPAERRDAVGRVLFWASEQQYRTPNERLNNIRRHPTAAELDGQMTREGLTPEERTLYDRIRNDFGDYLTQAERETINLVRQRITDPAAQAAAIGRVQTEYAELRAKPYFPMTRFGRWTIAVRDLGHPDQPVIGSYAYDTRGQRDAALDQVRAAFPGQRITYGTVPDTAGEFMGLPGPLLREVKTHLPGITRAQLTWIEEFEHLHAPDQTFRRRWLPQSDMPGYSMDAMRAYASFFTSGANYLARLVHTPTLEQGIREIRDSLVNDNLANTVKRQEILKYVTDHYQYMSESGRDWGKSKAFISLWQLGFSPAAAFTNLLQTPTTTLPYLMGHFGNTRGVGYLSRALDRDSAMPGNFAQARVELQREGLIDVGQAADLAMYAEGHNTLRAMAGNAAERLWREVSYRGMWLFQRAEQLNREVTAKAAWLAAMENPNHARVVEVQQLYPREMGELQTAGLNPTEAASYLYAKDVLEKTQFVFAKWNRPPFLRSNLAQVAMIFFKYTQNMIELYRLTPGLVQTALIQAALFGVAGLPGAEDLNQVMRSMGHVGVWLLRKFGINYFGKDFDLLDKAREHVRKVTQGTVFDKTGPDLFLHGLSRYGFGLGLLPEGYGIGQFDASQNGSLGRIVPGLQEGLKQMMFGDYKTGVSDVAGRAAGAGYGWIFTMLKYMSEDPGTFDSKTWEGLLPRAGRQVARTYRFATEGLTTRQGGRLVKFDMSDPEDLGAMAAQLAGYTPTKVSEMQDVQKDLIERQMQLKMEKTMLYGQLYKAVDSRDPRVIADVFKAIKDYNEQVGPEDPTQIIQQQGLLASMQRRAQQRALQTSLQQPGQVNKATIPMYQRILENYPGVVDRRRVQ